MSVSKYTASSSSSRGSSTVATFGSPVSRGTDTPSSTSYFRSDSRCSSTAHFYTRAAELSFEKHDLPGTLRCVDAAVACGVSEETRIRLRALQALVPRIPVTDAAVTLAVALGRATRPKGQSDGPREVAEYVRFGAGPRGSQALVLAAKARAALRGEAAADVEDVRALVVPVLRHRLVMSYRAEAEGVRDTDVLKKVVDSLG